MFAAVGSSRPWGTQFGFGVWQLGDGVGPDHLRVGAGHVHLEGVRREVAEALSRSGHDAASELLADNLAQTGIAEKEERLVALDRSADDAAEVIAVVRSLRF